MPEVNNSLGTVSVSVFTCFVVVTCAVAGLAKTIMFMFPIYFINSESFLT